MKKKITIFLLSSACLLASGFAIQNHVVKVDAIEAEFSLTSAISEKYARGSFFEAPEAYYSAEGMTYTAKSQLIYPNGGKGSYDGTKIMLSECGEYSLIYQVDVGGKSYVDSYTFQVENNMASLFEYGDGITVENNVELPAYLGVMGESAGSSYADSGEFWASTDKGVKITINEEAENKELNYAGIIDLSKIGFSNNSFGYTSLYQNQPSFIEFMFTPRNAGRVEAERFEIILTDIYDESNFLTIEFTPNRYGTNSTNVKVSAKNMYSPIGTYAKDIGWAADGVGTYVCSSMYGKSEGHNTNSISLFYDYADNEMNIYPITTAIWPLMYHFNDELSVGYGNAWEGFTTGEVFMTFRAVNFKEPEFSFTVLNVAGQTVASDYTEKQDVQLRINDEDFDPTYDYVVAGKNRYFEVFDAVAYASNYGTFPVHTQAYYGTDKKESVPIRNGKFAVEKTGIYTLQYSVYSPYGNKSQEMYITAKSQLDATDALDYKINDSIMTTGKVGERIYIYDGEIVGGIGKAQATYALSKNGKEVQIDYDTQTPSFVLNEIGEYMLTFFVQDAFGNVLEKTKTITCVTDEHPRLLLPTLPKAFIKGHTYSVPQAQSLYFVDGTNGNIEVSTYINGTLCNDKTFVATEDFTLQYKAAVGDTITESEVISCMVQEEKTDTNYVTSYFYNPDASFATEIAKTGIYLKADGTKETGTYHFLNYIHEEYIALSFSFDEEQSKFAGIDFTLIDAKNANRKLIVSYDREIKSNRTYIVLSVNGQKQKNFSGSLGEFVIDALDFAYDSMTKTLLDSNDNHLANISHYQNGDLFDGFADGVYLDISMRAITGESRVLIKRIATQNYTESIKKDTAGPKLILETGMANFMYIRLGESLVCPAAIAYDTFNSVDSVSISIEAPNGETVYSGEIDKAYTFTAAMIGNYVVKYQAKDTSANKNTTTKTIYVNVIKDDVPEIVLGDYSNKTKINNEYTLANATVLSENETILFVYVLSDKGMKYSVKGNKFTFKEVGTYTVCYYVIDEFNNYNLVSYKVEVTK